MKKPDPQSDDTLLDFLDGNLDDAGRAFVQEAITGDPELKKRLDELTIMHEALRMMPLESPSKNFTTRVLTRLQQQPARNTSSIRRGLLLLIGTILVTTIAVVLLSAGVFDQTTIVDLNNNKVTQQLLKQSLPMISIDGKWLINAIVLLNLVIAFLVLDRAILKPLFQRRLNKVNV